MKTLLIGACALFSISSFASNCVELAIPLEISKTSELAKAVNKHEQGHYAKKAKVGTIRVESICEADKKGAQSMRLEYEIFADLELSCMGEVKIDAKGKYDVRSLCEA